MIRISLNAKLGLPHGLPPLCWNSPWASALFMFGIDFGMLAIGWWVLERVYHRQYFWSNLVGDSIGLPTIAFSTTVLLQHLPNHRIHAWYTTTWWYLGVLAVGVVIIATVTYLEIHTGNFNWEQEVSPSKAWHTLAWPAFFWVLVAPAPAALAGGGTAWALVTAIIGIAIWADTLRTDLDRHPTPLGGVVEFSWPALLRLENPSRIRTDQWIDAHKPLPSWFSYHYWADGKPAKAR